MESCCFFPPPDSSSHASTTQPAGASGPVCACPCSVCPQPTDVICLPLMCLNGCVDVTAIIFRVHARRTLQELSWGCFRGSVPGAHTVPGGGGYSYSWEAVLAFANIFCSFVHIWKRHTVSGTCLAQKQGSPQSSQARGTELRRLLRLGQSLRAVPFPPDTAGALITVHYCYECL